MSACSRYHEDLALLAGGDLPQGAERSAAEAHAEGCAACAGLLRDLGADLAFLARASRIPEPDLAATSLVAPVLAHVAAEAVADGLFRPQTARRRSDLGLVAFGRIAATVAIVAAAGALGFSLLLQESGSRPATVASHVPVSVPAHPAATVQAAPVTVAADIPTAAPRVPAREPVSADRPVRVHRAGGPAVALEWESDGREAGHGGSAGAYKVLASASPKDFTRAEPVLVAGMSLVAGSELPSMRTADRSITFFRVE